MVRVVFNPAFERQYTLNPKAAVSPLAWWVILSKLGFRLRSPKRVRHHYQRVFTRDTNLEKYPHSVGCDRDHKDPVI